MNFNQVLHIYGQGVWHDEAYVVGDRAALERLRDAISSALVHGQAKADFWVNDGEGFPLYIFQVNDMEKMAVPYTEEMAAEHEGSGNVGPWEWVANNLPAEGASTSRAD